MNCIFNPPEYNADGTKNSYHALTEFVLVFIDDLLIFSNTANDHKCHLDTVLKLRRKKQILIKASKCAWAQPELPYLGHIVGRDDVKPDPTIQSVGSWPQPTTVEEGQQFPGLTNFFRQYVQACASIASPLRTDEGER